MKDQVNVGVVGCGYWGPNLIRNFASLVDCRLWSICDVDEERLSSIAHHYPGVYTHSSFEVFLSDDELDAVVIAVPVRLHFELASRALQAGKHVFIEKPMAASVEECDQLIELAAQNGLTLMVGHTFLYSPAVRKIKEIVDSGEIGHIQYISSRRLNLGLYQDDINVAWDLAPHDLSIILHLIDSRPVELNCRGKTRCNITGSDCRDQRSCRANIPDVSNMTLVFEDGCFATIHNSWIDPLKVRDMAIVGDRKMIVYDELHGQEKVKIFDERIEPPVLPHEPRIAYHYGDIYTPYIHPVEPLKIECEHFIECIITGKTPLTDGWAGRELVNILMLASESMYSRGNSMFIGEPRAERDDTLGCDECLKLQ